MASKGIYRDRQGRTYLICAVVLVVAILTSLIVTGPEMADWFALALAAIFVLFGVLNLRHARARSHSGSRPERR